MLKNTNIKDIAKAAGVAVSTVSRVLNNHPDVKRETKENILRIIDELNYVPNNSARNLKRASSKNIGIFVRGEYNPFFAEIVESIEKEISANGYSAIVHFHHNEINAIESAAQFVLEKKLIGLIYLGGILTKDKERFIEGLNTPMVFTSTVIEEDVNKDLFSSVGIDDNKATKGAIEYLISLGHRKIAIISAEKQETCAALARYEAFLEALDLNNIEFNNALFDSGDYSFESGYDSMKGFLHKEMDITAVFAVNDMMAIGAAKAVFDSGLKVPDDISIVGFDGLNYGTYFQPSLTTVRQPNIELGKRSTKLLFDNISNKSSVEHVVLETELLKRDSCRSIIS